MLQIDFENNICKIQLNRPELHNAFNPEMIEKITKIFISLNDREDLRLVILSGMGKSFCAGADLNWMKDMKTYTEEENIADAKKLFTMFESIAACEIPVLCIAHGNVFGGGIGLLAAADIVAMEESTKLCFSEVKWGLSPATICPFVMKKTNKGKLREWMLSASVFSANEAKEAGLVQFVGTAQEMKIYLEKSILAFSENSPSAVRATKKLIGNCELMNAAEGKDYTAKQIAERRISKEGQEGLEYFLTKTKPSWKN